MRILFSILTIILLLTVNVYAGGIGAPPMAGDCTKDCNFNGTTTLGDVTAAGDITATGDISGEDINVGGVWLLEVQNCTGQPTDSCCYNGTQLICKKSDDETTDALDTGAGSGYWSISGSDIFYSAGLVSIGSETDSNSQFLITTPNELDVVQSFKILNQITGAEYVAGANFTCIGENTTTRCLYVWSPDDYGLYLAAGIGYFADGIEFKEAVTSLADDGEHYFNATNTSDPPCEVANNGDIHFNSTDDQLKICDGGVEWEIIKDLSP